MLELTKTRPKSKKRQNVEHSMFSRCCWRRNVQVHWIYRATLVSGEEGGGPTRSVPHIRWTSQSHMNIIHERRTWQKGERELLWKLRWHEKVFLFMNEIFMAASGAASSKHKKKKVRKKRAERKSFFKFIFIRYRACFRTEKKITKFMQGLIETIFIMLRYWNVTFVENLRKKNAKCVFFCEFETRIPWKAGDHISKRIKSRKSANFFNFFAFNLRNHHSSVGRRNKTFATFLRSFFFSPQNTSDGNWKAHNRLFPVRFDVFSFRFVFICFSRASRLLFIHHYLVGRRFKFIQIRSSSAHIFPHFLVL